MRDDTVTRIAPTTEMLVESLAHLRDASEPDMPAHLSREDQITAWACALFVEFHVACGQLDLDVVEAAAQIEERIKRGLCAD